MGKTKTMSDTFQGQLVLKGKEKSGDYGAYRSVLFVEPERYAPDLKLDQLPEECRMWVNFREEEFEVVDGFSKGQMFTLTSEISERTGKPFYKIATVGEKVNGESSNGTESRPLIPPANPSSRPTNGNGSNGSVWSDAKRKELKSAAEGYVKLLKYLHDQTYAAFVTEETNPETGEKYLGVDESTLSNYVTTMFEALYKKF